MPRMDTQEVDRVNAVLRRAALALLVVICAVTLGGAALDQVAIDWIASHAVPLERVELAADLEDLRPLAPMLAGARVIGVGEATHGTREFFTVRLRLIDFLARELSVHAFAFEFPFGEGLLIDRYVQTGEGDPADVLARVYCPPWNNRETLEAIEWMRAYNEDRPEAERVSFHGIDMHDGDANLLADAILAVVADIDPQATEAFASRLDAFRYASMYHAAVFTDPDGAGRDALQWVVDQLALRKAACVAKTSLAEYEETLHCAELLLQRAEVYGVGAADPEAGNDLRDRYMADNVVWLLESLPKGGKVMLGAHNFHVGRFLRLSSLLGAGTAPRTSAGWHLGERLGDGYVVVGTMTVTGELAVFPFPGGRREQYTVESLPRTPYDAHATLFRATGIAAFLLDLRAASQGAPETQWMFEERPLLQVGTMLIPSIRDSYLVYTPLRPCFDLIAYIETTGAPTMLPWVPKDDL